MTRALTRWALPGGALVSLALAPAASGSAPWGTGLLLLGGAGGICYWMARRVLDDGVLAWLALGGLMLRAALSPVLYAISLADLPILRQQQFSSGFWTFAPDARHHHVLALGILDAWRDGIELPAGLEGGWYFLIVAAIYKAIGVHPLHGAWLNAAVGGFSALLAFAIARRLGGIVAGRIGAGLVAFWPSLVLWSTQLLKEEMTVFLVLLALYFSVALCDSAVRARQLQEPWARWRLLGLLFGASAATMAIAMARPLYALALGFSALAVFGWSALVILRWREASRSVAALTAGALMLSVAFIGQPLNPLYFFASSTPWEGHYARGVAHLERGNAGDAELEFIKVLDQRPGFRTAEEQLRALVLQERAGPSRPGGGGDPGHAVSQQPPEGGPPTGGASALWWSSVELARRLAVDLRRFPETLSNMRIGLMPSAGHSPIDPDVRFSAFGDVLYYLPRSGAYFFLSPFPWQVFDTGGVAGVLKSASILEPALVSVLLAFAAVGTWRLLRARNAGAYVLLLYLLIGSTALGLTMVGLGSLFRYRVPFLLVLFVLAGVGISSRWTQAARPT